MTLKVRFAPSPTGYLHVGNVRAALINWLFASRNGAEYLLRLDDTDDERSTAAYADAILEDLAWLGITHDHFARQSERFAAYDEAARRLKADGRLYPCYETPDELERKRKRQLARGLPPVYDRSALDLTADQIAAFEKEGRQPHWRFKLEPETVHWVDLVRGETHVDLASVSDPVLIRADGRYLYTLPSVVDDIDFGITHVIRGEDHVTNTGAQIQLLQALGAQPPVFAHYSLLVAGSGERLSKRKGALSIRELRDQGIEPMAINSLIARIGTSDPVEPIRSLEALAEGFDFGKFGRAPAHFDLEELRNLNAKLLHETPFADVAPRLAERGIEAGADFWDTVRPNLTIFDGVAEWWRIVEGPIDPVIEDIGLTTLALELLPPEPWGPETWKEWTSAVAAASGAKGKALYMPLRLALTGLHHGPELKNLLPLIGSERARARLAGLRA